MEELVLLENQVCLLVKPKTQPSQRSGEGKIYDLQQIRRTLGNFIEAVSPEQQNRGPFKLSVHADS